MRLKDFKQWEALDLVRSLEEGKKLNSTNDSQYIQQITSVRETVEQELRDKDLSFLGKACERAQSILSITDIGSRAQRVRGSMKLVELVLYLVMALLGGFAVTKLFSASGQVNIFKILLLLLGVNLFSMFFYCMGVFKKQTIPSIPTSIFKLINRLKGSFQSHKTTGSIESKALISSWAKMNLSGSVGKWTFARMINAAWSSYLLGGLIALLTVLSFKQVEFTWGTTILSSDSFLSLTRWLAWLPEMIGFTVPNEEQIMASRLAPQAALNAFNSADSIDINRIWAHFLIASVLLYAVLPRFILWAHAVYKQWSAKRSFTYNMNTPYIVNLRERLTPHIEKIGITDADTYQTAAYAESHINDDSNEPDYSSDKESPAVSKTSLNKVLPNKINGAAYEWSLMDDWPITNFVQEFGNITNRADKKSVLSAIESLKEPLAICIKSDQVADRGAQRFFSQLAAKTDLYILIISETPLSTDKARWSEWLSLSAQVGIPDDRLFFVDMRDDMNNIVDKLES